MPGGDRTGPMGLGPMTGRQAGYCVGSPTPGYMNPGPGRGMGFGRGWGRGRGRGRGWGYGAGAPWPVPVGVSPYTGVPPVYGQPSADAEVQALKAQATQLEGALNDIRQRIGELEASKTEEGA